MKATPIPSSWVDRGAIILQTPIGDTLGMTVRATTVELYALYEESRSADNESARWQGYRWHRDHIAGAMRLAIDSGLVDTCQAVDGRRMCERPVRPGERACPNHEIGATA